MRKFQKSESDIRVSFLPNVNGDKKNTFNKVVLAALEVLPPEASLSLILGLLNKEDSSEKLDNRDTLDIPVSDI